MRSNFCEAAYHQQPTRRTFLKTCGSALAASSALTLPALQAQGNQQPPNIVMILVDDLGWTDVACYGSQLYETPHIDRLAQQGMRFTQGYAACTVCSPTRASILTGQYPARLHITDWIAGHPYPHAKLQVPKFNYMLPHERITIAEALSPLGYASASIGKWHLGGENFYPPSQGFDQNIAGTARGMPPSYFSPYRIPTLEDGPEGENLTDRMAAEAVQFIEDNAGQPFFLYLPLFAVHTPIQGKQNLAEYYRGKIKPGMEQRNAEYAAMIHTVDQAVGSVMKALDDQGVADNTLVVFTGDNGGLIPVTSNLPLRAGKGSAYEGGVRVPFIVRWPDQVAPGSLSHKPVISADLMPTILEATGASQPQGEPIDGVSLMPELTHEGNIERDTLYWHYPHYHPGGATPHSAIRQGDYKLIHFYEDDHVELYDLANDIGESYNLADAKPQLRDQMLSRLQQHLEAVNAQMPKPNPNYDPDRADKRGPYNNPWG